MVFVIKWQRTWLAKLCSCFNFFLEVEFVGNKIVYLAEDVSEQSVKGIIWFLLTAFGKIQEEKNELKKKLLSKKEPELKKKNWNIFNLFMLQKMRKCVLEDSIKVVVGLSLIKHYAII